MNDGNWETIKKCAKLEKTDGTPAGLIVDSPWIPGYAGMSTLDYFTIPGKWLGAQLLLKKDFPGLILIPDFWVEYGMAAEPSGFGCKIKFYENNTPAVSHLIGDADDIGRINTLPLPDPRTDGLMPLVLNQYKNLRPRLSDIGESVRIVAARGPFTIAAHLMGLTEFLLALKVTPDEAKKLIRLTAAMTKTWLEAQAACLPETEGILVLDDIMGFLSRPDYLEFAHEVFKQLFHSFRGNVILFHNDTDNPVCYEFLAEYGVNIFNFTHKQEISRVRALCGDKVCLMGNVPPLQVLCQGTPSDVTAGAKECLAAFPDGRGLILSAGGGASPGTPKENVSALLAARR